MPVNFPPVPVYPTALDSDSTLFLVYNTTETVTTADSPPWGEEIEIRPVKADESDIWAENGFATISGELLYYDSVEKNSAGNIIKLKNCVRNLGGSATQFNAAGTDIRSFVIAEHHNQLVDAIVSLERFLGPEEGELEGEVVTCGLDEVEASPVECEDDGNCPIVDFTVTDITENANNCSGTVISYTIDIEGVANRFDLDFGDGTNTSSTEDGTHTYAPGAVIDPIVTASNDFCEVIVTPHEPLNTTAVSSVTPFTPTGATPDDPFIFPVPQISIPNISITPIDCPSVDISIPPIVGPAFELDPFGSPTISVSTTTPTLSVPSVISLIPTLPSVIEISPIVPTIISIEPPVPSVISVTDDISDISLIDDLADISLIHDLTDISLVDTLSDISLIDTLPDSLSLVVPDIPDVSVAWGTPPTISACVTIKCPSSGASMAIAAAQFADANWEEDDFIWEDEEESTPTTNPKRLAARSPIAPPSTPTIEANIDFDEELLGIPSEININPPIIPDINVKHDIPTEISLSCPTIPEQISFVGLENMPTTVELAAPANLAVPIDASSLPSSIEVDWGKAPRELSVSVPDIPPISIEHDIPTTITVEGIPPTISVEGMPDSIEVTGFPESLKVDPVEVVVKLDMQNLITHNEEEGHHCVALVPCKPK